MNCPKFLKKSQGFIQHQNGAGFTLIELLVVIGILAVLLSIVLIAINPARQIGQANNTKRQSDVGAVLNAVGAFAADSKGVLPAGITTTDQAVSNTAADICTDLVPTYISALPTEPTLSSNSVTDCTQAYNTGYNIVKDANGRVTVSAPTTDNSAVISVQR